MSQKKRDLIKGLLPATPKELVVKTKFKMATVLRALEKLESRGRIIKTPDGSYKRAELKDILLHLARLLNEPGVGRVFVDSVNAYYRPRAKHRC